MTSATAHFASMADIANAIKAQVEAVKLSDGVTAAFQRVELFSGKSIEEAFMRLFISQQRVCIIVPVSETWQPDNQVRKLLLRKISDFMLLISDRAIGDVVKALYGDGTNAIPGALNLCSLTEPFVTGQLIQNPNGVISKPLNSDPLFVSDSQKQNLPGRAAVSLDVECKGGWMEAALGAGPTL